MVARVALAMELEVNSEAVAVETVEVVAGGDDDRNAALMEQQLMAANAQELIVPSAEARACVIQSSVFCMCNLLACACS